MQYSFRDEVIKRLPAGHQFVTMTSANEFETDILTVKDAIRRTIKMSKVDITRYFESIPTITISKTSNFNDVYSKISDLFGLGLVQGVDYYNSSLVKPSQEALYVELPINSNSSCYRGFIRCYVSLDALSGANKGVVRDLRAVSNVIELDSLKVSLYLAGQLFAFCNPFAEDKLTEQFIHIVVKDMDYAIRSGYTYKFRELLKEATVKDVFNDGLSDIILINLKGEDYFIRYHCPNGSIPLIKNNEKYDLETSTANAVLVGVEDSVAENPGERKGELLYTASRSDIPIEVVTPPEEVKPVTKKTRKKKKS